MLYAAYGSNLSKRQMRVRCPNSNPVGIGKIQDYTLKFDFHADIVPCVGRYVMVGLWDVADEDWAMLDKYEGVKGGYYKRVILPVETSFGVVNAVVYVMCGRHGYSLPDSHYFNVILDGYEDFGIGFDHLRNALIETAEHDRKMVNYIPERDG